MSDSDNTFAMPSGPMTDEDAILVQITIERLRKRQPMVAFAVEKEALARLAEFGAADGQFEVSTDQARLPFEEVA